LFIQHQSASLTVLIFQRLSSQPFCGLPRCTVTPAGRARACGAPTIVRIRDRRHSWRGGNQTKKLRIPLASSSGYGTQRKSIFEEPQWLQTFAASKSHICSINKRVSKTSHRLRLMASRDREAGTERPPCYLNLRPSVRLLSYPLFFHPISLLLPVFSPPSPSTVSSLLSHLYPSSLPLPSSSFPPSLIHLEIQREREGERKSARARARERERERERRGIDALRR